MDDCESCPQSFCSLSLSVIIRFHQSGQAPRYPLSLHRNHTLIHHMQISTHPHSFLLSYLQPVRYLRQMCDPWLLVNEFPFIQVAELGPIKTHPEISSKHPLMALEGKIEMILY